MAEEIPYEEMRRILGLPDMTAFVKQREEEENRKKVAAGLNKIAKATISVQSEIKQLAESIRKARYSMEEFQ